MPRETSDPDLALAKALPYLSKPLTYVDSAGGGKSVVLRLDEFRELLHHLRTLTTLANAIDDESVSMEELTAELRASGRLPA